MHLNHSSLKEYPRSGTVGAWIAAVGLALAPMTASAQSTTQLLPDLTVSRLSAPTSAQPGTQVPLDHTVVNQGNRAARNVVVSYALMPGNLPLGSRTIGRLRVNQSQSSTVNVTIPRTLADGTYEVVVVVDGPSLVRESNESNNRATREIQIVGVTPPPPPPSSGGDPMAAVDSRILGTCSADVHDRYAVAGPDGKRYRTWHPTSVSVLPGNPASPSCTFAHDHGDDPSVSQANATLPPFGYVGLLAGHNEPHEGFKVAVANRGRVNDEGRTMLGHSRVVFHMGTGGIKRFTTAHHSAMVDVVMPTGQTLHLQGMFDTNLAGSICQRDASLGDGDPSNDIGRTVVTVTDGSCPLGALYEIWQGRFDVQRPDGSVAVTSFANMAVFDPITVLDQSEPTKQIYTKDAFASRAGEAPFTPPFNGCNRETYHGSGYWYNRFGPTVYFTDAFGKPGGPIRQEVSQHEQIGIDMSARRDGNLNQFKLRQDYCAAGLGLLN